MLINRTGHNSQQVCPGHTVQARGLHGEDGERLFLLGPGVRPPQQEAPWDHGQVERPGGGKITESDLGETIFFIESDLRFTRFIQAYRIRFYVNQICHVQ